MQAHRRNFLISVGSIAIAGCVSLPEQKKPLRVYLATGTAGPGTTPAKGIYAATFDSETGAFGVPSIVADAINPMYIGVSPDRRFLYSGMAAPAIPGGNQSEITAYAIDHAGLTKLNAVSAEGLNARWPTVDREARNLLYINYETGQIMVRRLGRDGQIGDVTCAVQHVGKSIVLPRQEKPHPHAIRLSPSGRYAVVADLGMDQYVIYKFGSVAGTLVHQSSTATTPGAGPRHFVFHPNGKFVYGVNELNSTVNMLGWNDTTGELKMMQTLPALPVGFKEANISGDILVHPNGRFLYVTNRGHESIAIFSINAQSGELKLEEHVPSPGKFPWALSLDPTDRWLLVANQKSNTVSTLKVVATTGSLTGTGQEISVPTPTWICFA